MLNIKQVTIPARAQHDGFHKCSVNLYWYCPECGGERGELFNTISFDGSRRLGCNGWRNPCGHIDKYDDVRVEASTNGLN